MEPIAKIASYALYAIETGTFGLDGGAMFGVVPKPLWEKKIPSDAKNRIKLSARALLLEGHNRKILIDVGLGTKWQEKEKDIYAIDQSQNHLVASLELVGLKPKDISDVILTHLHFDHAGGSTHKVEGKIVPTFPKATYHVQERNWNHANQPTLRDKASYLKDDFFPLSTFDQLKLYQSPKSFDHDQELFPGIQALVCDGHTPGLQMIKISDSHQTVVYCADTIPTHAHLSIPWVMGYDLEPLKTLEEKRELLKRCFENEWQLFFEHDCLYGLSKIASDEQGRPRIVS